MKYKFLIILIIIFYLCSYNKDSRLRNMRVLESKLCKIFITTKTIYIH